MKKRFVFGLLFLILSTGHIFGQRVEWTVSFNVPIVYTIPAPMVYTYPCSYTEWGGGYYYNRPPPPQYYNMPRYRCYIEPIPIRTHKRSHRCK